MTTFELDPQTIRNWVESELPGITCPSDDVLSQLSAGPAAREVWHFLTSRVRSEQNVCRVRAVLALGEVSTAMPSNEEDDDDVRSDDLQMIQEEIAAVEKDIGRLRAELRADDGHDSVCGTGEDGIREGELRNAFLRTLNQIEEEKHQQLDRALSALEAVVMSETDNLSEEEAEVSEPASNSLQSVLEEFGALLEEVDYEGDGLDATEFRSWEERIQAICNEIPMSRVIDALASDAKRSVGKVRDACIRIEGDRSSEVNAETAAELLAQDAQLCAYAAYDKVVTECLRAEKRVVDEGARLRDGGASRVRLLCAQLEGERAVLNVARGEWKEDEGCEEESGRLGREVRRANERMERIDRAMKKLCEGNRILLAQGVRMRRRVVERVEKELEEVHGSAMDGAERVLGEVNLVRRMVEEGCLSELVEKDDGYEELEETVQLVDRMGREQVACIRRKEALDREKEFVRVGEGLRLRGELCEEAWERMMSHTEEELLPRIQAATEEARRCREHETVYVQDELRNLVRAPAREVAKQLGLLR